MIMHELSKDRVTPEKFTAVIEISKGSKVKYEIDEETEDFLFPQNNTYFLLAKNEKGAQIREDLDKVLKEMKEDGTIAEITKKYLGVDTSVDPKYLEETIN